MPTFERESRCIFLGLKRHERGASFSVKTSYLHQIRMQAYKTTPKKDESGSEGHSQRRVAETIGSVVAHLHLPLKYFSKH